MNKRLLFILFVFSFLLASSKTFSTTTINVSITQPAGVASCRENAFVATYVSPGSHHFSLNAFLTVLGGPSGTACDNPFIKANVYIVITSVLNATPATFPVDTNGHDCLWSTGMTGAAGDTVRIYYKILIDCANLSDSANSNIVLNQDFADTSNAYSYHVSAGAFPGRLSISNVKTPYFLNTSPAAYNAYYLDTLSALYTYYNTGTADASISFRFYPDTIGSCMANAISLEFADSIGGSFTPFGSGSLTSAFIKTGKALVIRQKLVIDSCFQNCGRDSVTLLWQCNLPSAGGIFCTECQHAIGHHYDFIVADNYTMDFGLVEPVYPVGSPQWEYTCLNDTADMQEWVYRITKPHKGAIDTLHVSINNARGFPNELALIKPGTFFIDGHCVDCTIDTALYTTNLSLCNNLTGPGLDSASAIITKFRPGDTLYVHYRILRCAEENDLALMNKKKYFNTWSISVDPQNVCKDGDHFRLGSNSGELNLKLFFLPTVADMSVPKGELCGDISRFNVDMNGLADPYTYPVTGLFGCNSDICDWQGYLKAKVHCSQNLRLINVESSVYLQLFDTSSFTNLKRYPVYYNFGIDTAACEPGDYFFYFNLSDSLTQQIIKHGQFSFEMQACCGGEVGQSPYEISFYLLADPGTPGCINLSLAVDTPHVSFPECGGPGCAWIPLSGSGDAVQVHCPGCKAPGIVIDSYKIKRVNFGLQDSDNDKRADNSLKIITDTSAWYKQYEPLLGIHNSSFGDALADHLTAHFEPGSLPDGYTYPQMISGGAYLNDLQLFRTIPDAHDLLKLNVTGLTFYIDAADNVYPNCLDCGEFGIDSSRFRTQLVIKVSGSKIFQYFLDTLSPGGRFLFTFSSCHTAGSDTGNLHNPAMIDWAFNDTLNPFLTFSEGQHYRLKVNYKECGMFAGNGGPESDFNTYLKKAKIFNKMALTGKRHTIPAFSGTGQMPNTQALLDSIGYTVDIVAFPGDTLVNSIFAGSKLFFCETFTGVHFFFTDYILGNASLYLEKFDCAINMNGYGTDAVANNRYEAYPYEYRPAALAPVEFKFQIPPGYFVDSAFTRTALSYGGFGKHSNYHLFTPPAATGTVTVTPSDLPPLVCLTQQVNFNPGSGQTPVSILDSSQYAGDAYTQREVYLICKPFHCSDSSYQYNDSTIVVKMDTFPASCFSLPSCGLDQPLKYGTPVSGFTQGKDVAVMPNVHLADSTGPAYKEQFCTKLKLTNKHTTFGGNNSNGAYNVFISVPDTTLTPYLSGWTFNNIPVSGNGIIHAGTFLKAGDSLVGNLCGYINQCHPNDNIKIYYGWNCNGYPETTDPDSICFLASIDIPFISSAATLTSNGKSPTPHFNLCDTFIINVPYNANNAGGVRPDSVILTGVPSNLQVTDVLIGNATGQTLSLSQTSLNAWRVTGNDLYTLGYSDTLLYSLPYPGMDVKIKAFAGCGYTGSPVGNIILYAHKYCGDTLIIQTTGSQYANDNHPKCTDCFTVAKSALSDTISAFDTTGFLVTICGNANNVSSYAHITELLPTDFTLMSVIPDSLLIPAFGCDTFTVYGYFQTPGSSVITPHINTVIVSTSSGNVKDTAGIGVSEPCALIADTIIPDNSFSHSNPVTTLSGMSFLIQGLFTVDQNLMLTNCTVYMAAGSQIVVKSLVSFILDSGTSIIGCHQMWRGIVMESNSTVGVYNRSLISDADTGIFINNRATIHVINGSVIDCVIGLYVAPHATENNISARIYGSRFGMFAGQFKPHYSGQGFHGDIPFACIVLNDVATINIGLSGQDSNYFYNANIGVLAARSITTLANNEFDSIYREPFYTQGYGGSAVVGLGQHYTARASNVTINPLTGGSAVFHNSNRGVYTHYSRLFIAGVLFDDIKTGIYNQRCTDYLTTRIINCTINASLYGIRQRFNEGSALMLDSANTITMSGDTTGRAIYLEEGSNAAPTANYRVTSNTITLNDAKRGIFAQNVLQPVIVQNTVNQNNMGLHPLSNGLMLNNTESAFLGCNQVNSTDSNYTETTGLHVKLSKSSVIECNNFTGNYKGAFFGGACAGTSLKGNTLNRNFRGLELDQFAVIGFQNHHGNLWTNYRDTVGAVNFNNTIFGLGASEFEVHSVAPGTVYYPFIPAMDSGWFVPDPGTPFVCGGACEIRSGESGGDQYDHLIAGDSVVAPDFIDETKNIAEMYLFEKLKNDTTNMLAESVFSDFYIQHENGTIGALSQINNLLESQSENDAAFYAELISGYSQIKAINDSLLTVDSLEIANPNVNYIPIRQSLYDHIVTVQDSIKFIVQQDNSFDAQILADAQNLNNGLNAQQTPESNEQFMNEIYLLYLSGGEEAVWNFYDQILEIAEQCPYSGGPAVFRARTFKGLFDDSVEYDDALICQQAGYSSKIADGPKPDLPHIFVIPNPADEKITVNIQGKNKGVCRIGIFNSMNSLVFSEELDCKEKNHEISTKQLSPGVYIIRINGENIKSTETKLIIIR